MAMSDSLELTPEQRALFTLSLVPNLGPRLIRALIARFGSAEQVLRARPAELNEIPRLSEHLAGEFGKLLDSIDVQTELELVRDRGVHLVFLDEAKYPPALPKIADPPPVLYVRGSIESGDANAIALVGSRQATAYGLRVAHRLAADLARAGMAIISGLARGIDAAAHRGAMEGGGRTLAVLACGLSMIYPPEHADLAAQVAQQGALLTEFNMHMQPLPQWFPRRNRIISGMARAVVVVEASQRSGALITARHALEQGREVFAVPGPVDSVASSGTLQLIREGARLVRSAEDIIEDLKGIPPPARRRDDAARRATDDSGLFQGAASSDEDATPPANPPVELDDTQRRIWEFLAATPRSPDEMAQELGLSAAQMPSTLLMMEMKKVIRRLPGNRYERF